jgi:excisionase family DNA binding protein
VTGVLDRHGIARRRVGRPRQRLSTAALPTVGDDDRFLRAREVTAVLGVSRRTTYRLIGSGELKAVRVWYAAGRACPSLLLPDPAAALVVIARGPTLLFPGSLRCVSMDSARRRRFQRSGHGGGALARQRQPGADATVATGRQRAGHLGARPLAARTAGLADGVTARPGSRDRYDPPRRQPHPAGRRTRRWPAGLGAPSPGVSGVLSVGYWDVAVRVSTGVDGDAKARSGT